MDSITDICYDLQPSKADRIKSLYIEPLERQIEKLKSENQQYKNKLAEVQPIVYCRNCKFYNKCDENLGDCMKFKNFIHCVGNDWYCNFGARMDGDTNEIT